MLPVTYEDRRDSALYVERPLRWLSAPSLAIRSLAGYPLPRWLSVRDTSDRAYGCRAEHA